jgi:predicted phosphoribosyltransferase
MSAYGELRRHLYVIRTAIIEEKNRCVWIVEDGYTTGVDARYNDR